MKYIIFVICLFLILTSFKQPSPKMRIEHFIIQTQRGVFETTMAIVKGKPLWVRNNGKKTLKTIYRYDTVLIKN